MNSPSCEKEQRVLECLLGGSWPGPAGESLPEHTVTCPVCSDLVLAVEHFSGSRFLEMAGDQRLG